jgi:hypothetical protein
MFLDDLYFKDQLKQINLDFVLESFFWRHPNPQIVWSYPVLSAPWSALCRVFRSRPDTWWPAQPNAVSGRAGRWEISDGPWSRSVDETVFEVRAGPRQSRAQDWTAVTADSPPSRPNRAWMRSRMGTRHERPRAWSRGLWTLRICRDLCLGELQSPLCLCAPASSGWPWPVQYSLAHEFPGPSGTGRCRACSVGHVWLVARSDDPAKHPIMWMLLASSLPTIRRVSRFYRLQKLILRMEILEYFTCFTSSYWRLL